METIADVIKNVISTRLISSSLAELAETLGYRGRSTLYRVLRGDASERAVEGLCRKLNDRLCVDENMLRRMNTAIINTNLLRREVGKYLKPRSKEDVFRVVAAFVFEDYEVFPDGFRESELNSLMVFRRSDPTAFFNMLAYYYYKYSHINYYIKGKSHRERSSRVMEALGEEFVMRQPENDVGATMVLSYSDSEVFNSEPPILWSLIESIAVMLQFYSEPIETLKADSEIHYLDGLHKRDYWSGRDKGCYVMTQAVDNIAAGSGQYSVFKIDKETGEIEFCGRLSFLSDGDNTFYKAGSRSGQMGEYEWDMEKLTLEWERQGDDPTGCGNRWSLLELKNSQSLRELDRSISDERLYAASLKADGLREMEGYRIKDVVISRESLSLILEDGRALSINLSEASFLAKVSPRDVVMVYERPDEDLQLVCWPKLMHCLLLERFTIND